MANEKKIIAKFQFRRDTTENWIKNKDTIPAAGEPCYDINLKTFKIGDGTTTYENLPVIGGSGDGDVSSLAAELAELKIIMEDLQDDVNNVEVQVGETNVVEVKENVENLSTEMITVQQTLETKVDEATVDQLETDLRTYIDEQIKNIETTNNDYGEV